MSGRGTDGGASTTAQVGWTTAKYGARAIVALAASRHCRSMKTTRIFSVLAVGLSLAAVSSIFTAASAAEPVRTAFAYDGNPAAPIYTPSQSQMYNSAGKSIDILRNSTGQYHVMIRGLAADGGSARVDAVDGFGNTCAISGFGAVGVDEYVDVSCFAPGGAPADTQFNLSYTGNPFPGSGAYAHVWSAAPAAGSPWSYDSKGGSPKVVKTGTGAYVVTLPHLGSKQGIVNVTSRSASRVICKPTAPWSPVNGNLRVTVGCFDAAGHRTNAAFYLTYAKGVNLLGEAGAAYSSVLADQPTASTYQPAVSDNSTGKKNTVTRVAKGQYLVLNAGFSYTSNIGNDQVVAVGSNAIHCNSVASTLSADGLQTEVVCTDKSGKPADSSFAYSYSL